MNFMKKDEALQNTVLILSVLVSFSLCLIVSEVFGYFNSGRLLLILLPGTGLLTIIMAVYLVACMVSTKQASFAKAFVTGAILVFFSMSNVLTLIIYMVRSR